MDIINTELCLADLESVDKKKTKTAKLAQAGIKQAKVDLPVLEKVYDALQNGTPARALTLSEDDLEVLKELNLITLKPVLYVLNMAEDDIADPLANKFVQAASAEAEKEGAKWFLFPQKSKKKCLNWTARRPKPSWKIWEKKSRA